jgi:hypothetical protein
MTSKITQSRPAAATSHHPSRKHPSQTAKPPFGQRWRRQRRDAHDPGRIVKSLSRLCARMRSIPHKAGLEEEAARVRDGHHGGTSAGSRPHACGSRSLVGRRAALGPSWESMIHAVGCHWPIAVSGGGLTRARGAALVSIVGCGCGETETETDKRSYASQSSAINAGQYIHAQLQVVITGVSTRRDSPHPAASLIEGSQYEVKSPTPRQRQRPSGLACVPDLPNSSPTLLPVQSRAIQAAENLPPSTFHLEPRPPRRRYTSFPSLTSFGYSYQTGENTLNHSSAAGQAAALHCDGRHPSPMGSSREPPC